MIKFKTFSHEYQVVDQLNEWESRGYNLTRYFIRITQAMTPVQVYGNQSVFNIFYDDTLDEKRGTLL